MDKNINRQELPQPCKPERHPKGWGFEDWICNNKHYCGKLLFFKKGKRCSFHYHEQKHETFYLFSGKLEIKVGWSDEASGPEAKTFIMEPGDCLEIKRNLRHQMTALADSNLFEFSTTHYEHDSKRIVKGD